MAHIGVAELQILVLIAGIFLCGPLLAVVVILLVHKRKNAPAPPQDSDTGR